MHNIVVPFPENEAHLHPRWRRSIAKGLRTAIPLVCEAAGLLKDELQLFLSAHSPLVMSTPEDEFESSAAEHNRWLDFYMYMSTRKVDIADSSFSRQQEYCRQIFSEPGLPIYGIDSQKNRIEPMLTIVGDKGVGPMVDSCLAIWSSVPFVAVGEISIGTFRVWHGTRNAETNLELRGKNDNE